MVKNVYIYIYINIIRLYTIYIYDILYIYILYVAYCILHITYMIY